MSHARQENSSGGPVPMDESRPQTPLIPWLAVSLALFGCGVAATQWCGVVMTVPSNLMWFLEPRQLATRLGESLLYLHAQPPLLNLWLGLAFKLEAATGWSVLRILLAFNLAVGAASVAAYCVLAVRLLRTRLRIAAALALLLANPFFYHAIFDYRYTIHEIFFLLWVALFAQTWLAGGRLRHLVAAGLMTCGLVYLRSLFHFAWAIGLLVMLALMAPAAGRAAAARRWSAVAGFALILLAWPLKNALIFGLFSYSSWQGYNISQGLEPLGLDNKIPNVNGLYAEESWGGNPVHWTSRRVELGVVPESGTLSVPYYVGHPDVGKGRPVTVDVRLNGQLVAHTAHDKGGFSAVAIKIPAGVRDALRLEVTTDRAWTLPDGRDVAIGLYPIQWQTAAGRHDAACDPLMPVLHDVPAALRAIPVLTVPGKSVGRENWNHYWVIDYSRRRQQLAMDYFRQNPGEYFHRVANNYLYLTRYSGRNPYVGYVRDKSEVPRFCNWMKAYELVVMQDARRDRRVMAERMVYWPPSGFMFTLPAILFGAAWRIRRDWRRDPRRARLALVMFLTVLWVIAMILFIDGTEGNRIRFSTEPFLWLLALWAVPAIGRRNPGHDLGGQGV